MRRQGQKTFLGVRAWLIGVVFLFCSSSVFAVPVVAIQYCLNGNDTFYVDHENRRLFFYEDSTSNDDAMGWLFTADESDYYEIRNGSIELTDSRLLQDRSGELGPGIALGLFEKGATLTITGRITSVSTGLDISPYGTIIEATVTDDFYAEEQQLSPNSLNLGLQCNLIGGELFNGALTGFVLERSFMVYPTLYWCTQFGNPKEALEDFASDIGYATGGVVQINPTPEPASLILFGLTGLFIMKKSKTNKK
jgi:hypothetical protein